MHNLKPYFAKYLPVEGELLASKPPKQKMKLFLCSRDIQVGDTFNHKGYHESEATSVSEGLVYNGTAHRFKIENCWKVIGEISPEAIWVKEGDEFDNSDICNPMQIWDTRVGSKDFIGIKCPTCKKFH